MTHIPEIESTNHLNQEGEMNSQNNARRQNQPGGNTFRGRITPMSNFARKISATLAGAALAAGVLATGVSTATAAPTPASSGPDQLKLVSIKCIDRDDWFERDQTSIKVDNKKVWGPKRMDSGQTRTIDRTVSFDDVATIRLFELEHGDEYHDRFGSKVVYDHEYGNGNEILTFKGLGYHYEVKYRVIQDG